MISHAELAFNVRYKVKTENSGRPKMDENSYKHFFLKPEKFDSSKKGRLSGPNGWLLFVACNSGINLAKKVKEKYEVWLDENSSKLKGLPLLGTEEAPLTSVFSDTETCPRLTSHVAGSDAYVFQCVHDNRDGFTVNENIQQLLQMVRTLRAHRAKTITVVNPYSPYSRQDKPTFMQREAALASLFADQLKIAGADMYLTYHPHTLGLYGFYEPEIRLVALSGLDLFMDLFKWKKGDDKVVAVSTDAGGAKFTVKFADQMDLSYAIVSKIRTGKDQSSAMGLIGDLEGKEEAILIDDETVTGSSLLNTVEILYKQYGIKRTYIGVSHLKAKAEFLGRFIEANREFGLQELHVTDSVPQQSDIADLDFVHVHELGGIIASTINRLHFNRSVSKVFSRH